MWCLFLGQNPEYCHKSILHKSQLRKLAGKLEKTHRTHAVRWPSTILNIELRTRSLRDHEFHYSSCNNLCKQSLISTLADIAYIGFLSKGHNLCPISFLLENQIIWSTKKWISVQRPGQGYERPLLTSLRYMLYCWYIINENQALVCMHPIRISLIVP